MDEDQLERVRQIEERWADQNLAFKDIPDSGMEYTMSNGYLLVTPKNNVHAVFADPIDAQLYTMAGADVRYLLELLRTKNKPENDGEKRALQAPTE